MSKHLEQKKESITRMNRVIADLQSVQETKVLLENYKDRYENLLKRYEKLNKVFEFHKGIIQNISSCIVTTDLNGEITFMNRSALELLDYSADTILGKSIEILFADKDEVQKVLNQVLNSRSMFESKETNILARPGTVIPIGFSTTILKQADQKEISGIIFIFRDIRDLNNFRKQMARMDRLATLGELSAGIAHEIRNPLAGIKTSAQVLEESFSPGDFRAQLIARIVKEIDRSNKLLQRFFNFAKPSRPKPDFHDLKNIIDGVYMLLGNRFSKKKIEFFTHFQEDIPPVYIDESQLEQVFLNLFLNAIDSMPNGGSLKVVSDFYKDERTAESQKEPGVVQVKIIDTGVGISPEKIEKIFNPFYTSKSDGVGLGLSICLRLLDENQSKLEVSSVPLQGTVFTISLPYVKKTNIQE